MGNVLRQCKERGSYLAVREYRWVFIGALALDILYLILSLCFSFFSWRTVPALMLGTAFAVVNSVLREWTVVRIVRMREFGDRKLHMKSYLGRMALAGVCMAVGFAWLDPFAVAVPMLAPNVAYHFLQLTGREI